MRISTLLALTGFGLLACTPLAPTRSGPTTTAADEALRAPPAPVGTANGATLAGPPPPAPRCRLTVTDTEGCKPGDMETLVEHVRPQLERCRTTGGGKVRVRVRRVAGGKLAFDTEPGSSLDPTEQHCVLDALSTLDVDESSTAWTGLNVRPTGFTSLLTIEW
jgi:hypothetical protein